MKNTKSLTEGSLYPYQEYRRILDQVNDIWDQEDKVKERLKQLDDQKNKIDQENQKLEMESKKLKKDLEKEEATIDELDEINRRKNRQHLNLMQVKEKLCQN